MEKQTGTKYDAGKPRWGLILGGFTLPLRGVVEVGTFGAKKYGDNNWQLVENGVDRYESALFRHWAAWKDGEKVDPETGISHLAHMAWNALAMYYHVLKEST